MTAKDGVARSEKEGISPTINKEKIAENKTGGPE